MPAKINTLVEKPWGHEVWLALTNDYCFKRIEIKSGHRTSLHYCQHKEETCFLLEGDGYFHYQLPSGDLEKKEVQGGFFVHLVPGAVHAFEAVSDIVLMASSNKYVEDVVRLKDDYGRISKEKDDNG